MNDRTPDEITGSIAEGVVRVLLDTSVPLNEHDIRDSLNEYPELAVQSIDVTPIDLYDEVIAQLNETRAGKRFMDHAAAMATLHRALPNPHAAREPAL